MRFYSQKVVTRCADNFCARCERKFQRWDEYHAHVTDARCALRIRPIRTTNRTKMQIVLDWEVKNKGVIIE